MGFLRKLAGFAARALSGGSVFARHLGNGLSQAHRVLGSVAGPAAGLATAIGGLMGKQHLGNQVGLGIAAAPQIAGSAASIAHAASQVGNHFASKLNSYANG